MKMIEKIKSIGTMHGEAFYIGTCIEKDGKCDDDWKISEGYYVIHEGRQHHVYKVVRKR